MVNKDYHSTIINTVILWYTWVQRQHINTVCIPSPLHCLSGEALRLRNMPKTNYWCRIWHWHNTA